MKLTLQQIRNHRPCREGWTRLFRSLGNPSDMTTTVSIGQIARSNGSQDALWCLRCDDFDRRDVIRAIFPSVKRASVHADDARVAACIIALDKWLAGDDTIDLNAAKSAAYAAIGDAAYAAAYAVYAAVGVATRAAVNSYAAYALEIQNQVNDICKVFP